MTAFTRRSMLFSATQYSLNAPLITFQSMWLVRQFFFVVCICGAAVAHSPQDECLIEFIGLVSICTQIARIRIDFVFALSFQPHGTWGEHKYCSVRFLSHHCKFEMFESYWKRHCGHLTEATIKSLIPNSHCTFTPSIEKLNYIEKVAITPLFQFQVRLLFFLANPRLYWKKLNVSCMRQFIPK